MESGTERKNGGESRKIRDVENGKKNHTLGTYYFGPDVVCLALFGKQNAQSTLLFAIILQINAEKDTTERNKFCSYGAIFFLHLFCCSECSLPRCCCDCSSSLLRLYLFFFCIYMLMFFVCTFLCLQHFILGEYWFCGCLHLFLFVCSFPEVLARLPLWATVTTTQKPPNSNDKHIFKRKDGEADGFIIYFSVFMMSAQTIYLRL